jgi:twitching motility protein PilI
LASLARVPYTKPWFLGVVNLRGGLYGVVDLARFMGGAEAPARDEASCRQAQLVTLNVDLGANCALVVDELLGLRRQDAFSTALPTPLGSPAYFGHLFLDAQGQRWQEIDLHLLSQSSSFLEIGA